MSSRIPGRAAAADTPRTAQGRPVATTHAAIEQAAFALFARRGFAGTTLDDIAAEVGVGRRTLFRYYASKNDIPWGQFDRTLDDFRRILDQTPAEVPLWQAVHRAVVRFNEFPEDADPGHRERMTLILTTPELQAHSALRYAEWRGVIASFVADRLGCTPADPRPGTVAHVSLALALAAYDQWMRDPDQPLAPLVEQTMSVLRHHLGS